MPFRTFRARHAIPELGAQPGDHVLDTPLGLQVIRATVPSRPVLIAALLASGALMPCDGPAGSSAAPALAARHHAVPAPAESERRARGTRRAGAGHLKLSA